MAITCSFRFDASDDAVTDASSKWTGDANFTDGLLDTYANSSASSTAETGLFAGGTNAPESGPTPITQVQVRVFAWPDGGQSVSLAVYTDGLAELLGTAVKDTAGQGWGGLQTLSEPTGGWTWAKIAALEFKLYATTSNQWVYDAEIVVTCDVTTTDYKFDGSDDAIADPSSNWTDESNVTDATYTNYASSGGTGDTTTAYLQAGGTAAPESGDAIDAVLLRFKGGTSTSVNSAIWVVAYTDGLAQDLGRQRLLYGLNAVTDWQVLTVPTGGWTWVKIAALEFKAFTIGANCDLYYVEVGVVAETAVGAPWYAYAQQ